MTLPADIAEGLRLPVLGAPMFLVSGTDLVLAQCAAGVLGSFPTSNARTVEILDEWLDEIDRRWNSLRLENPDAPPAHWAVNVVSHKSNNRLADDLKLIAEYRPRVVITALGGPKPVVDIVHNYGGMVWADVNSVHFARKALDAGADGLVLVGAGAGGHTGKMHGLPFLAEVREFFDGPVALGGGLGTGGCVRAVEAAGADLANMGTAFIATEESLAPAAYKNMLVNGTLDDLVLSDAITGVHAYWLKESVRAAGLDPDNLVKDFETNFAKVDLDRKTQERRDRWRKIWSAGHGIGHVDGIEPVAGLVGRLSREYADACARPSMFSPVA